MLSSSIKPTKRIFVNLALLKECNVRVLKLNRTFIPDKLEHKRFYNKKKEGGRRNRKTIKIASSF